MASPIGALLLSAFGAAPGAYQEAKLRQQKIAEGEASLIGETALGDYLGTDDMLKLAAFNDASRLTSPGGARGQGDTTGLGLTPQQGGGPGGAPTMPPSQASIRMPGGQPPMQVPEGGVQGAGMTSGPGTMASTPAQLTGGLGAPPMGPQLPTGLAGPPAMIRNGNITGGPIPQGGTGGLFGQPNQQPIQLSRPAAPRPVSQGPGGAPAPQQGFQGGGGDPQARAQAGGFGQRPTWQQMAQQIRARNPGIDGHTMFHALKASMPYIQQESAMELREQMLGIRERQITEATRRMEEAAGYKKELEEMKEKFRAIESEKARGGKKEIEEIKQRGALERTNPRVKAFNDFVDKNPESTPEQRAEYIKGLYSTRAGGTNPFLDPNYKLTDNDMALAQAIRSYNAKPLDESTRNTRNIAVMGAVRKMAEADGEEFDTKGYGIAGAGEKNMLTGRQSDRIRSLGTAQDHLQTLVNLSTALNSGESQAINNIRNIIRTQFGDAAANNLATAKQIIAAEVISAVTAAGGGVKERMELAHNITEKSSPDQIVGQANTLEKLMEGQMDNWRKQWDRLPGHMKKGKTFEDTFGLKHRTFEKGTPPPATGDDRDERRAKAKAAGFTDEQIDEWYKKNATKP